MAALPCSPRSSVADDVTGSLRTDGSASALVAESTALSTVVLEEAAGPVGTGEEADAAAGAEAGGLAASVARRSAMRSVFSTHPL